MMRHSLTVVWGLKFVRESCVVDAVSRFKKSKNLFMAKTQTQAKKDSTRSHAQSRTIIRVGSANS